ncbi:MAG TPA: hypothetical protein VN445_11680 [Rectinemataceae bacterium]|nr:hypothetical protein [Rectinemataceae bacterium]
MPYITPSRKINSVAQLEREWNIFRSEIESRKAFQDNSLEARQERKNKGKEDILFFGKTYFPEYFIEPWAPFHKKWPAIARIQGKPTLVAAIRGAGKSTFFSFLETIHKAIFGLAHYQVLGAYDYDRACLMSARVLLELLYNPRLASDFGAFFSDEHKPPVGFFVVQNAETEASCAIQAISIGQNPRGMIWGAYRPDTVVLDDIQTDKRARSKKWVSETLDWIFRGLIPALRADYSLTVLATYLNAKCVASMLKNGGKINSREYKAITYFEFPGQEGGLIDGKPTWPEVFSKKRLASLRETLGQLIYMQEVNLVPISEDGTIFSASWMRTYDLAEITGLTPEITMTRIDPATRDAKKNCKKAVITGSLIKGIIYIRMAWIRHSSVLKMIDAAYEQYDACRSYRITYEDNGGQALLGPIFDSEAKGRGYYLPLKPWTEGENKLQRIEQGLSADLEYGRIRFLKNDPDQRILIEQLVDFPNGDLDGPDALTGLVRDIKEYIITKMPTAKGGHKREAYEITRGYS